MTMSIRHYPRLPINIGRFGTLSDWLRFSWFIDALVVLFNDESNCILSKAELISCVKLVGSAWLFNNWLISGIGMIDSLPSIIMDDSVALPLDTAVALDTVDLFATCSLPLGSLDWSEPLGIDLRRLMLLSVLRSMLQSLSFCIRNVMSTRAPGPISGRAGFSIYKTSVARKSAARNNPALTRSSSKCFTVGRVSSSFLPVVPHSSRSLLVGDSILLNSSIFLSTWNACSVSQI